MPVLANQRHERFAQELAKGVSQTEAYKLAGYSASDETARRTASVLMTKHDVVARVAELQHKGVQRAEASAERIVKELSRIGFSDIRRAFDANGRLKPPSEWDDEFAATVASIEVVSRRLPGLAGEASDELEGQDVKRSRALDVEYIHKIKIWDKNSALEKLAKVLGMFIDRVELGRPGDFAAMPDDELMSKIIERGRVLGLVPPKALNS